MTISKLALVLFFIFLLLRLKLDLGLTMLLGSVLSGILFKMSLRNFFKSIVEGVLEPSTLELVGVVLLILILGEILRKKGSMEKLVTSLQSLIPLPRLVLVLPSSIMGLLPMPGGALFSAPMLEATSKGFNLSPERKTFLNFWFRHTWEYIWPLYPGLVMTAALWKLPVQKLIKTWFPASIVAILIGAIYIILKIPAIGRANNKNNKIESLFFLIKSLWEIISVVILTFLLNIPILVSMVIITFFSLILLKLGWNEKIKLVLKSISFKTALLLISVMVFKRVLQNSNILDEISGSMNHHGILSFLSLFLLPFIIGFLTGMNQAYVGIAFPVLTPIIGTPSPNLTLLLFAYMSGFIGTFFSPSHFCLSLSAQYFRADFKEVLKIMFLPSFSLLFVFFLLSLFTTKLL
jgi:integral membrane protein (TIGR00529 family)